jgi:penicillin-binding protein 1C
MQLARRLQPRRRTFGAKLIEAVRALQLEMRLGKAGVLADYLTLTPYGGNLEGLRAASLAYFGHEPDKLSDAEQALLIALPQAPEARRPDRHPNTAARSRIMTLLQARGLISRAARLLADADPLPTRHPFPTTAWQATGELARSAARGSPTVVSTLDVQLQTEVEALVAAAANAQGASTSVAVLVVDVRTRAVRAAVGSYGLPDQRLNLSSTPWRSRTASRRQGPRSRMHRPSTLITGRRISIAISMARSLSARRWSPH